MTEELPAGWAVAPLGEVVEVLDRLRIPINERERRARLEATTVRFPYYGATGKVGEIDGFLFEGESVLLGEDGAPFLDPSRRKAFLVSGRYWVNNHAHILRAMHPHSNAFLCHQLNAVRYDDFVSGTTRLKLTQAAMTTIPIHLPPPAEQRRIAARIDELFSELDEGERALERVQKLVERYRQSVLKAAVSGELSATARAAGRFADQSGEELLSVVLRLRAGSAGEPRRTAPVAPDTTGLPPLPAGWVWASIDQLCRQFGNGLSRKPAAEPPGTPILRISAVRPLSVNPADFRHYRAESGERLENYVVQHGDLLFTRYNGSCELVGVSGIFRGADPVLHPDKLIKARVVSSDLVLPDYLEIAANAGETRKFLASCVKTSAGQHGIAGADIKRAPVPLPPVTEQRAIVDVWRQAETQIAAMAAAVPAERRRGAALRQSILQAAFSGRLVPQDPADEPASALLARLAAPTAEAPVAARRRARAGGRTAAETR